jgi:outer membrane cobalamin receptor
MRYAFAITLILALSCFAFSMIGESGAYSLWSELNNLVVETNRTHQPLSEETVHRLDTIFTRNIRRWEIVRWLSITTSVASLIGFSLASRKKKI